MIKQLNRWYDVSVKNLLLRVLSATIGDKKKKTPEEEHLEKRAELHEVLKDTLGKDYEDYIGSVGDPENGRPMELKPGSTLAWAGGNSQRHIVDTARGNKDLFELGYTKQTLRKWLKTFKAEADKVNGKAAKREEEEKTKSEQENKRKLKKIIPSSLIGSRDKRVPGSPFVMEKDDNGEEHIIDVEQGDKDVLEMGYSEDDLQKKVKEVQDKVEKLAEEERKRQSIAKIRRDGANDLLEAKPVAKRREQQTQQWLKQLQELEEKIRKAAGKLQEQLQDVMGTSPYAEIQHIRNGEKEGLSAFGENKFREGWKSKGARERHLDENGVFKHAATFPGWTEDECLARAKALAEMPADGKNIIGYLSRDWDPEERKLVYSVVRYNVATNEFVKYNAKGLVTFFKPKEENNPGKTLAQMKKDGYYYVINDMTRPKHGLRVEEHWGSLQTHGSNR